MDSTIAESLGSVILGGHKNHPLHYIEISQLNLPEGVLMTGAIHIYTPGLEKESMGLKRHFALVLREKYSIYDAIEVAQSGRTRLEWQIVEKDGSISVADLHELFLDQHPSTKQAAEDWNKENQERTYREVLDEARKRLAAESE